ncbi:MAG: 4-hydroxybenzoyl-CoA reductase subunit beta [Roseibium sp.]|uniref:4-hydroxybenzoyl-CoA reductase subunit beta n=1 Tax=Roseibium sp. TaxID=1936156 RepID=UPI0026034D29|nr:4-hydroxybenzoyl-CoA reductase subunit beta [Roseibium sp.]MCV0429384.1 4-hydroxybenzoyl-CoA reductase subunit beta [Roseibium sp.]
MTEALPQFQLLAPTTLAEAVAALNETPDVAVSAGGTDLVVQLRRGLCEATTLVDLGNVAALKTIEATETGLSIGAGVTLAEIENNAEISRDYPAVAKAAAVIAGPTHRTVATLGGNLCLDTRCVYYNQSHWWRKSNDFCLKYKGEICHVAPNGNRCRAAFTGDLAPALMVHGAEIEIVGSDCRRRMRLADFYHEDGADHLKLAAGEIVAAVHLPPPGPASDYEKIRVRGSIDFPLAGVAVACSKSADGAVRFTVAITGTNSMPILIEPEEALGGESDREAYFTALGKQVQKAVSPQRTTTIAPHYRRLSAAALTIRIAKALL